MSDTNGKNKESNLFILTFLAIFAVVDLFIWWNVIFARVVNEPRINYLDVGQGDSELVVFPGNVKVLTDAGPDSKVVGELDKINSLSGKYIDIAVISHPQLDHFNGFRYLLDRYRFGAFIYNGRSDSPGVKEWPDLVYKIKQNGIPLIQLGAGDKLKYNDDSIDFLSPDPALAQSAELNDTGLVEMVKADNLKALLTADIGASVEKYLVSHFDLHADILKIAHHGSRYSSSDSFLMAVNPKVAIIEVGSHNNYGHPSLQTLQKLASMTAVFRTDKNGTITAAAIKNKLRFFTGK